MTTMKPISTSRYLRINGPLTLVAVVQTGKEPIKQETLLDAATLAAWHSKLRDSEGGDVVYTRRKHISKPKGAPPGKVIHSQAKTVHVRFESDRLERLLGKTEKNY